MFRIETVNELSLRATCEDGKGFLFSKAGAFICGTGSYKFNKILLGTSGSPLQALAGQIMRRLTGENMPLMRTEPQGSSITYYSCLANHVTVIDLQPGMHICVDSENLLAFNDACSYSAKFLGQGMVSQKGCFVTKLTGMSYGAQVAILSDGNPIVMDTGDCRVDPDAMVAYTGADPTFKLDVSFRNIIGQNSGETYMFYYGQPGGKVIVQPSERKSGLDIGIDGHGGRPDVQQNQSIMGGIGNSGNTANQIGSVLGGLFR